jgi:putative tryptophan/tyrosine transport system substrate-binding protein
MKRAAVTSILVTVMLLAVAVVAEAQQPKKTSRIGLLAGSGPATNPAALEVFRQALRELGYVEGENIRLEHRWAEGKFDRLPSLAAELVGLRADVIVTIGTQPTFAARQASNTIPIVVVGAGDLVGSGLIESLARPGGNVTGSTNMTRI